jgi:hypothetical protein
VCHPTQLKPTMSVRIAPPTAPHTAGLVCAGISMAFGLSSWEVGEIHFQP